MTNYKIEKDPITNKILSYTKVQSNTPLYSTDIIVDSGDLSGINLNEPMFLNDDGEISSENENIDNCDNTIQELSSQILELSSENDSDYFMRLIMDGATLAKARSEVQSRQKKLEDLNANLEEKKSEHQQHIRNYYLSKNHQLDLALECQYYSAVILLIKDENRYLKEWIDWHLALGFDHIYIYDNGEKDHVQDIVDLYSTEVKQKITVIDWTGHHTHIQQDAYNHFLSNYKADVRWGLFIDSDEFLRFTDGETTNVNAFLRSYEDYTEVWGYEVEYNANGHEIYENKPVRERFTRQTDVREGFYWKNFIQVNRIDSFLMHYAYYDESKHLLFKNEQSNQDLFVIDHYYTKSWEEWKKKIMERGGADPNYHKALREFFFYNPDMSHLDTGENAVQSYE